MTFPQTLTTRYFQLINNRKLTEAQRTLERIKQETPKTNWDRGYYKALQGMILAQKNNDSQYTLLSNINTNNKTTIEQHRNEFSKHVKGRFHDDFDRGFFSAWVDYTQLLISAINERKRKADTEGQTSIIQYAESTQKAP